ncbi:MAG TPA: branched-chain amino acid ABC transporter permease [Thermodesulfobacteriota bacterium]
MTAAWSPARLAGLALLLAFALFPLSGVQPYWTYTVTVGFYYAILAASWSLLVGYVGRISFAHAALAGLGAYVSVLAVTLAGLPVAGGVLAGVLATGLLGLGIGWLCLRLHGAYLGLTTIAFAEIMRIAITAEYAVTRGSLGLRAPPLLPGAGPVAYYYAILAALLASLALMWLLLRSRIGLFFQAIREDEDGASSLGVRVTLWKILAFAVSSAFAGLAGALYVHVVQLVAPSMMTIRESAFILTMAVIGGFQNVFHAALGGVFLWVVLETLRDMGDWRLTIFGVVAILILRYAPDGLFGAIAERLNGRRRGK